MLQLQGFLFELQVDIVPREERDDNAMMPRVPQPMSGAMAGKLHCTTTAALLNFVRAS